MLRLTAIGGPKPRQQLQRLRDLRFLTFIAPGRYRLNP